MTAQIDVTNLIGGLQGEVSAMNALLLTMQTQGPEWTKIVAAASTNASALYTQINAANQAGLALGNSSSQSIQSLMQQLQAQDLRDPAYTNYMSNYAGANLDLSGAAGGGYVGSVYSFAKDRLPTDVQRAQTVQADIAALAQTASSALTAAQQQQIAWFTAISTALGYPADPVGAVQSLIAQQKLLAAAQQQVAAQTTEIDTLYTAAGVTDFGTPISTVADKISAAIALADKTAAVGTTTTTNTVTTVAPTTFFTPTVIIAGLAALAAIGGGIWWWSSSQKKKNKTFLGKPKVGPSFAESARDTIEIPTGNPRKLKRKSYPVSSRRAPARAALRSLMPRTMKALPAHKKN